MTAAVGTWSPQTPASSGSVRLAQPGSSSCTCARFQGRFQVAFAVRSVKDRRSFLTVHGQSGARHSPPSASLSVGLGGLGDCPCFCSKRTSFLLSTHVVSNETSAHPRHRVEGDWAWRRPAAHQRVLGCDHCWQERKGEEGDTWDRPLACHE